MDTSSTIKVNFGALASAQGDIVATMGRVDGQLEDLRRFLAPMVATWEGKAAEDYRVKQQQWTAAAVDMATVLGQIGQALGAVNDGYQAAEKVNSDRWRV